MPKESGSPHLRLLTISFLLVVVFMVAEVVGGIVTQSLANALMVFGVAAYVLWTAIIRLCTPVDVESDIMLAIAIVGLVVNIMVMRPLAEITTTCSTKPPTSRDQVRYRQHDRPGRTTRSHRLLRGRVIIVSP